MKKSYKILSIALILTIVGVIIGVSSCEKDPPAPVYEFKLYDDSGEEILPSFSATENKRFNYEVEYDGKRKGANVDCLRDGVVFYEYKYLEPVDYRKNPMIISHLHSDNERPFIDKGSYTIVYELKKGRGGGYTIFETQIGSINSIEFTNIEYTLHIKII